MRDPQPFSTAERAIQMRGEEPVTTFSHISINQEPPVVPPLDEEPPSTSPEPAETEAGVETEEPPVAHRRKRR
jgi:hypothetical protein